MFDFIVLLAVLGGGWFGFSPSATPDYRTAPHAAPMAPAAPTDPAETAAIDFGDDTGAWANDGECDDPRFAGDGMGLPDADHSRRDASDCRAGIAAGTITYRGDSAPVRITEGGIDFGDDAGAWANDGECDDPRFAGDGMGLPDADHDGHDATDCHIAWQEGLVTLAGEEAAEALPAEAPSRDGALPDFGDDSSTWANDGECDDPRFTGPGMTTTTLLDSDIRADASDCRAAWEAGTLTLRDDDTGDAATTAEEATEAAATPITSPVTEDGVDFGTDSSPWANDDECDDPRFVGEGMTATTLLDEDIRADASDCLAAWRAGSITLRDAGEDRPVHGDGADGGGAGGGGGKIANDPDR